MPIPSLCTGRLHPLVDPCSYPLLRLKHNHGVQTQHPFRRYLQQDFDDWLGRLICRPGMENYLDQDPFPATTRDSPKADQKQYDIWDARALRSLKGPDGQPFFHGKPEDEGRYVFSLCEDGFNPFTSKEAGKKHSTGAIYMVCLNLPPYLRYQMENVFLVGIIPGPRQPEKDQINYLLAPLVDDLDRLYHRGVRYSKTPCYSKGRRIRVMLGPLVCDLPAARQIAGFGSHAHTHFCSMCKLEKDDMEELDEGKFIRRHNKEHREQAEAWRDAPTLADRDRLYALHGVRWSELLRLKYWKPVEFTVFDSMHCLFLGLLRRHCRNIWGMDIKLEDGDGFNRDEQSRSQEPAAIDLEAARRVLRFGTNKAVSKLSAKVMICICDELGLPERKRETKKYLTVELLNYVSILLLNIKLCSSSK